MLGVIRVGTEFLVNTQTDNIQSVPKITELADGKFLVSWTDWSRTLGDASKTSIKAQLFQSDGSRIGSEFLINTEVKGSQSGQVVGALSGGGFVIAWVDDSGTLGDSAPFSIKAQLFDSGGAKLGTEFLVNTVTAGSQVMPAVTALSAGGFVVSWRDGSNALPDTNTGHIKAQVFTEDGSKSNGEFLVNTITEGDQRTNAVAALKNGGFVIAWVDDNGPLDDPTGFQVKLQIFTANGEKVGGEFAVSETTSGVQLYPAITPLKNGNFVVSWNDTSQALGDTSLWAVHGQIFAPDGSPVGNDFLVNTTTEGSQFAPSIIGLADGGFVVSWQDDSKTLGDNAGTSIKAQVFTAGGVKSGSEFLVNTQTAGNQLVPNVAALGQGFGIVWVDTSRTLGDASDMSIKAQLFGLGNIPSIVSNGRGDTAHVAVHESSQLVTTVKATDADASTILVYSIAGGADAARFLIDPATGALSFKAAPDFERPRDASVDNEYEVIVKASDGELSDMQTLIIAVTNLNEAPGITSAGGKASAAITAPENATSVITVTASDPDAVATLTYAISGGADAAKFQINAATGALSFKTAPNFEAPADAGGNNVYDLEVQVSDGSLTDTQALTVTVTNAINETFRGTSGSDILLGDGGNDQMFGLEGNDRIDGGTGNDTMLGGSGNDTYIVDSSSDRVFETTTASATIDAGGVDTVQSSVSYSIIGSINGRQFIEHLTLTGTASINATGNELANTLVGNDGANNLRGMSGNDTLRGNAGNDELHGGAGADKLFGGSGNDIYHVENVGDRVYETATASSTETADLGGKDSVISSIDYTLGRFIENLTLTGFGNLVGNGNDLANRLSGGDGSDTLRGMGGNDTLAGVTGNDRLIGGTGRDRLTGGTGADSFVFDDGDFGGRTTTSADRIVDFSQAEGDRIDLKLVDANTANGTTDNAFTFIGTKVFSKVAGELRYTQSSGNTFVLGDTDGNGTADFMIRLDGLHTLTGADFVL